MVKPGYKQTEIGVIPEDWEAKQIGSFARICMCKRVFADQTAEVGDIPFYKIGTFGGKPDAYISRALYSEYKNKYSYPEKGEVLISAAGTLGRTVVFDGADSYFQDSNIVWLDIDKTQICNEYLKHFYEVIQWAASEGSTISRLYNGIIESTYVLVPPLAEQQRIAEALSDMDELIASLEKLIAKKKAIKQGAMQELLTGKRRLPGFSGEWNAVELRKLGRFVGGGTPSTNNLDWWKGKTPWISSSDLEENQIRTIKMSRHITEEAIAHSATNLCPAGAILVVSRVGVGKVAVAPVDLCTSQDFTNIIVNNCNPFFLAYTLSIVMKEKAATTQGTSIKGVTSDEIASIKVRIPSKLEQDAIVNALESIDQDIGSIEKQYLKSRQIKHGMMQQLLTGKIRL